MLAFFFFKYHLTENILLFCIFRNLYTIISFHIYSTCPIKFSLQKQLNFSTPATLSCQQQTQISSGVLFKIGIAVCCLNTKHSQIFSTPCLISTCLIRLFLLEGVEVQCTCCNQVHFSLPKVMSHILSWYFIKHIQ